jgi:propanol-preferring alcohol dehydrogenase
MRSYAVTQWAQPLELIEQPVPEPKGTEVLVRVSAAGVCHSDLHIHEGHFDLGGGRKLTMEERGMTLPITLGHETAGVVEAAGPDATEAVIGARVLAFPWIGCGQCDTCELGEEQNCASPRTLGIRTDGGYATHMLVPHPRYLLDIGDLPAEVAAPYACSGLTTYSALSKIDRRVLENEPILIIGAGGLGLMALTILKALNGRGAIVADIDPAKRHAASEIGALTTVDPADPATLQQIVDASAYGRGLRAAIDLVGHPSTVKLGMDSLVKGGKVIVVGLMGGEITLSLPLLPQRAMTIQGSYVGSLQELRDLMALVREQHIPPPPISTRPLDEAQQVIDELRNGQIIGRAVLVP